MLSFQLALCTLVLAVVSENENVNVSIQPAFHGIPVYIAWQKGWFDNLGININISVYASGGPQVAAAVTSQAWDVGIAGSVPNVLAGSQGISTIGISNDEAATTDVVGASGVVTFPPLSLTADQFGATASSTGELLLLKCLDAYNVDYDSENLLYASQGDLISNLSASKVSFAALWAPNNYIYKDLTPSAKTFCGDLGFPILGGLMVRDAYASANGVALSKVLAAYLRAVTFMQNSANQDETLAYSADFYTYVGVSISQQAMLNDLLLRPLFNLDEQIALLRRNAANGQVSTADKTYIELQQFLFEKGTIASQTPVTTWLTDAYMVKVSNDPVLRAYSYAGASDCGSGSALRASTALMLGAALTLGF